MARPIWKGHISFGLVSIPVHLYPAEERNDLPLHLIDRRDFARVRYERVNAQTGEEVPWAEVARGYEYSDGNYVILSDAELKRAAPEATKRIEIESFVSQNEIDVLYFDKPYYLEPGAGGEKGYVLLREVLKESGRVGIARVVIRTRQHIAALVARGPVLVLELLRYAQEFRPTEALDIPTDEPKSHGVSAPELKVARMLVDSMAAEWKPEKYRDEYHDALMKWIEQKVAGGDAHRAAPDTEEDNAEAPAPINFMEVLKKSLQTSGAKRPPPGRSAGGRTSKRASPRGAKSAPRRRKAG